MVKEHLLDYWLHRNSIHHGVVMTGKVFSRNENLVIGHVVFFALLAE
jgi:hypothetical protein